MYYSRYYTSSYNYDAEQDYEDLLDQHEWIQREEADFEDYLERRDEQAKKDEQDFEDYLERRGEQAEKDERDFERYMAQSAVPAREVEQTYRLEGRGKESQPHRHQHPRCRRCYTPDSPSGPHEAQGKMRRLPSRPC